MRSSGKDISIRNNSEIFVRIFSSRPTPLFRVSDFVNHFNQTITIAIDAIALARMRMVQGKRRSPWRITLKTLECRKAECRCQNIKKNPRPL